MAKSRASRTAIIQDMAGKEESHRFQPILMYEVDFSELAFVHQRTAISDSSEALPSRVLKLGSTSWIAPANGGLNSVTLSFDWSLIQPGALVVSNLLLIFTNAVLVDRSGVQVSQEARIRILVAALHALPWQEVVRGHIKAL